MNIIVIGGSGFIGTRLVRRLMDAGHRVRILDKKVSTTFPEVCCVVDVRDETGLSTSISDSFGNVTADWVINLAAEHRDDVRPSSLYDEVNVDGARNVCRACETAGIKKILFTSSVAVYGFAEPGTGEEGELNPFNDYGRTKAEAEVVYREWASRNDTRTLVIVRPTVVFGERNRGNVYNLLKQMAEGPFLMVGNGKNVKSVAYVENVAAFIEHCLSLENGEHLCNYVDKPDYSMNRLVSHIDTLLRGQPRRMIRLPYLLGMIGGGVFDLLARVSSKTFPVSAIRVKKFCSDTLFASAKEERFGFRAPVSLEDAWTRTVQYEFQERHEGEELFFSE